MESGFLLQKYYKSLTSTRNWHIIKRTSFRRELAMTDIITKNFNYYPIRINKNNHYFCLTDIAKAANVRLGKWKYLKTTNEYLKRASRVIDKPISEIIYVHIGHDKNQGTWAYPSVAFEFAKYCSKELAEKVAEWSNELHYKKEDDLIKKEMKQPEQPEIQSIQISNDLDRELDIIERCLNLSNLDPTIIAYLMLDYAKEFYPNIKVCVKEYGRVLKAMEESEQQE